jgi:hypothetical protein
MAVKSGQILHDVHGFVVDRIQSGGVDSLDIPEEKIYELGNFESVETVRDTPNLSFGVETLDTSTEFEALLTFIDPTTVSPGDEIDLNDHKPMDIIAPFKAGQGLFTVNRGLIIPYLTLESSTYRFALRQNSSQQHTLRGDSYFFADGAPYYQEFSGNGVTSQFNFDNPALPYRYGGDVLYAVSVCVVFSDGTYRRLFFGEDYTNTNGHFNLLDPATDAPAGSTLRCVYASAVTTSYPQSVHATAEEKPGAVRGRDIDVYIATADATTVFERWTSVQSFEVSRRVTLDADEEFGNPQYVAQDYDVPEVSGSITVKPRDNADLWDKVFQVADVTPGEIAGPLTSVALPVELHINDDDGSRLKTLYIPDARFKVPGVPGRVQTKMEVSFEWSSDGGTLLVYDGERP